MIISGFPGTGKSTAVQHFTGVVDLESTPFKKNWEIYADVAQHMSKQGYTVLVSSHKEMREELLARGEDFVVAIPNKEDKDIYIQRYKDRGNTEAFVKLLEENFETWIDEITNDKRFPTVVLDADEFICNLIVSINEMNNKESQVPDGYEPILFRAGLLYGENEAVDSILNTWKDTLFRVHGVNSFEELTKEQLLEERSEATGTLELCELASDDLGIACNTKYIAMLDKIIDSKE